MIFETVVRRRGRGLGFVFPPEVVEKLRLKEGDKVYLEGSDEVKDPKKETAKKGNGSLKR